MNTPIIPRDLTRQAPHSPRDRLAGFALASRAVDKCRATLAGTPGTYHYDCPMDNLLFTFKGITGEDFKTAVQGAQHYEEVGAWLEANGTPKTPAEIKTWSDAIEAGTMMKVPEQRAQFIKSCSRLGLDPEKNSTFDWVEAEDREAFRHLRM